jgi:hypothetical protein
MVVEVLIGVPHPGIKRRVESWREFAAVCGRDVFDNFIEDDSRSVGDLVHDIDPSVGLLSLPQVGADTDGGDVGIPQFTTGVDISAVDDSLASAPDNDLIGVIFHRFRANEDSSEQFLGVRMET